MEKRELYREVFDKHSLNKEDVYIYFNEKISKSIDKVTIFNQLNDSVDKLTILCTDLKLRLLIHQTNPFVTINSKAFYTTKEAAEILNISTAKIRELVKKGILSYKEISKTDWKIRSESIEAYKNDLSSFLNKNIASSEMVDVIDIYDSEMQIVDNIISMEAIHKLHEYFTRNERIITNLLLG